jgi:uncharacterized protein YegL
MIPHMRDVANDNPNAEVLMRVLAFSTGAHWHVETPKPIEDFVWQDLSAGGRRDLGAALILLSEALTTEKLTARGLPPVLVLLRIPVIVSSDSGRNVSTDSGAS